MPRQPAAIEAAVSRAAKDMGYFPQNPEQLEAVYSFIQGNNIFVSLPTGYGKSVIYVVLPTAFDNLLGMFIVMRNLLRSALLNLCLII